MRGLEKNWTWWRRTTHTTTQPHTDMATLWLNQSIGADSVRKKKKNNRFSLQNLVCPVIFFFIKKKKKYLPTPRQIFFGHPSIIFFTTKKIKLTPRPTFLFGPPKKKMLTKKNWCWCYYPHWLRDSVSPVCFFFLSRKLTIFFRNFLFVTKIGEGA